MRLYVEESTGIGAGDCDQKTGWPGIDDDPLRTREGIRSLLHPFSMEGLTRA